jgi:hypothetical protein
MSLDFNAKQFTLFELLEAVSEGDIKVSVCTPATEQVNNYDTCRLVERLNGRWHLHFGNDQTVVLDEDCDDKIIHNTHSTCVVWTDVKGVDYDSEWPFEGKLSFYRVVTQHVG